jgi:outer membrane receptor for ferrienterochelin and colicins
MKLNRLYVNVVLVLLSGNVFATETINLDEVEVKAKSRNGIQFKLRDEIVSTESVSEEDIRKSNASTLNEAIDNQPGVNVQVECSICNVRNVVLNNLPGRFTTIMIDGVPIFSSVSGAYGLDMIGINGVERIDVARGAGASLIAPESLSGVVNIVSKRPQKDENVVSLQAGNFGYKRGDGYLARTFEGGAFTASFNANYHDGVDGNGNKVSEYTGYDRKLLGFGIFLDDVADFKIRGRVDIVEEERGGGSLSGNYDAVRDSATGNPFDWSRGKGGSPDSRGWIRPDGDFAQAAADGQNPILLPNGKVLIPYDSGKGGFSENIYTDRQQAVLSASRNISNDTKLKFAFGIANHRQDSFYEGDFYKAKQLQHYSEASIEQVLGQGIYTVGVNYRYEDLRSNSIAGGTPVNGLDNYTYRVPAVFLQGYHTYFDDKLEGNLSVRYDKHNEFGGITSPRLNLAWHHTSEISSRFAVGRGFRAPTSFFEQDHGILATTRIQREIKDAEISTNASYAFEYAADRFAFVASANYNKIKNFALLDPDAIDAGGNAITLFKTAENPVVVKGIDATFTYKVSDKLDATIGAEKFHYEFDPGTLVFARPEERVYLRADYDAGNWDVSARANWTGRMNLAKFYDYANNPRFNLDGTPKKDKSPSYWVVDVNGRYKFTEKIALLAGVTNLFDFKQTDKEDFLFVDSTGAPDVVQLWGPNRGRAAYAGLRFDF